MNISSNHTGIVESAMIINQAYDTSGSLVDLNVGDYHVLMYVPTASVMNGPGTAGTIGATTKLGGFYHVCTDLLTTDVASLPHFY